MTIGQALRTFVVGACTAVLLAAPVAGQSSHAAKAKPSAGSAKTPASGPTTSAKGHRAAGSRGADKPQAAKHKRSRSAPRKARTSAVAKAKASGAATVLRVGEAAEAAAIDSTSGETGPRLIADWWKRPVQRVHAASVPTASIDTVMGQSRAMLGVRYVLGGQTPSGVDCTGLANYLYRGLGYDLPRVPRDLAQVGATVPFDTAAMRRGDLIFFSRPNAKLITHVGVYVGEGKMIHASSVRGRVVETSLSSYTYMARRGVKRIVNVADGATTSASSPD